MSYQLDHVGHVVVDLEKAMKVYERLGIVPSRQMDFPEMGSRMVFYPFGGIEIELIAPGGKGDDPASRCLKERGEGIFHLSMRVDDYDAEISALKKKGFSVREYTHETPEKTVRLAFLEPEEVNGLWIEFIEL
jgi:methylmalonyl-CoA/ethylmalonyl-CoA epimerase